MELILQVQRKKVSLGIFTGFPNHKKLIPHSKLEQGADER